MAALRLAALRGVDVRIIVPEKGDNPLVDLAARYYANELSDVGLTFMRYTDGFPHQKVMLVDHSFATVGTANFDNRSFRLNFEITAVVADRDFASQVEQVLEADFARSRLTAPGEYDAKPWWFRFAVRIARLTAPVQ